MRRNQSPSRHSEEGRPSSHGRGQAPGCKQREATPVILAHMLHNPQERRYVAPQQSGDVSSSLQVLVSACAGVEHVAICGEGWGEGEQEGKRRHVRHDMGRPLGRRWQMLTPSTNERHPSEGLCNGRMPLSFESRRLYHLLV